MSRRWTPEELGRARRTLARACDPRPSGQPGDVASIRASWRARFAEYRRQDQEAAVAAAERGATGP